MRYWIRKAVAAATTAAFVIAAVLIAAAPARAQGVAVVRDAEIESLLKDYAAPIFRAAGIADRNIRIVLVSDGSFNAFVDGRRIFINTGALLLSETPGEIIGVIAHEAGHIAGGHQQRLREQIARAQVLGVVGSLLGVGAVAAGSLTGSEGAAGAGVGMMTGAGSIAQRSLLSYRRSEEMNADQAAIQYLEATGQSGAGMLTTFERFSEGLALLGSRVDPYKLSHPLPRERIAQLERLVKSSPYYGAPTPQSLQIRHDLMRGKIAANVGGAQAVQRAFRHKPGSVGARYGYAIAAHLSGNSAQALGEFDALIASDPDNAYFHEMKGEVLLSMRRPGDAAAAFQRAAALDDSGTGIIRAQRGFALINTGNPADLAQAINELRAAISIDPTNLNAYRQLARAYGQSGDVANAELAMAEGHFTAGNSREARAFAARALQKLQPGTPSWRRANDIVTLGN